MLTRLRRWWRNLWTDHSLCWLCRHPKAQHQDFAGMPGCNGCLDTPIQDADCWLTWPSEKKGEKA